MFQRCVPAGLRFGTFFYFTKEKKYLFVSLGFKHFQKGMFKERVCILKDQILTFYRRLSETGSKRKFFSQCASVSRDTTNPTICTNDLADLRFLCDSHALSWCLLCRGLFGG